jgi:hypothetical protein
MLHRATLLGFLMLAPTAHAALGEGRDSVQADSRALGAATPVVTSTERYELHESRTADGGVIRQYVNAQGSVFAVTWSSRFRPNLEQLLGAHYAEYLSAARGRAANHHVFSVATPGFVLGIVQRPRGSAGTAHLPALLPAGVRPEELR